jgi:hypothetical protein
MLDMVFGVEEAPTNSRRREEPAWAATKVDAKRIKVAESFMVDCCSFSCGLIYELNTTIDASTSFFY